MKLKVVLNNKLPQEDYYKIKSTLSSNGGYCPCALLHTEDTKCMCKEFREQNTEGECHCGLYKKVLA